MAVKLFERIDSVKSLFAVETISLIYSALTSIMILFLYSDLHHPALMLLERLEMAVATFILIGLYRIYPCRITVFIRMIFQMILLTYWYPDTFEFNRIFPNLDHLFARAEQFLFGCQPAVEFCKHWRSVWISEPFNMGYVFYYPLLLIVTLYYFLNHFEWFEKVCFILVTSFFIYYFIYIILPVAGPQFYFPAIGMDKVNAGIFPAIGDYFNTNDYLIPGPGYDQGFFFNLVEASQEVGERPTAAFPSSHVGVSTIAMIMVWRAEKRLFYILFPLYLLLCGATVYIQAHYLIDAIAGFVSAFFVYRIATMMYEKWFISPVFRSFR